MDEKGWVRTSKWRASPLYRPSDAGKWGLRFQKRKKAHHTKGTLTWASKADGAKFDTEAEATAAIVDWWTAEEQYKGNVTQCAALARASAEPPVGLAAAASDDDEAAAAAAAADAASDAASDDDARDAARASDDPPVGVAAGAAADGGVAAATAAAAASDDDWEDVVSEDDVSEDDVSEDDAHDMLPPPPPKPLPVFYNRYRVDVGRASSRTRSSFSDDNVHAALVELVKSSREALRAQLTRLSKERAKKRMPSRKSLGRRSSTGARTVAQKAAAAATVERRAVTIDARNEEMLPHIDLLDALICAKMTHTLLVGFDETKDLFEQFTEGQVEHCETQCKALRDYLRMIVTCNTGDACSGGLTQRECAEHASVRTYGKAIARTIQRWYNHNYVANAGMLAPRDSGLYERDTFVEWFVQQSDLVSQFVAALKANLRHMSLQKAADLLNIVLKYDYEDAEDAHDEVAHDGEAPGAAYDGMDCDGAADDGAAEDDTARDRAAGDDAAHKDGAAHGGAADDGAAEDDAVRDGASHD
ncbi:hypothetical protein M885DRAFT_502134 [Pelagophyceae sp. CCMP2097]|nr:hypothetical protein M885DRAFT_502134 [Pelagophyceae sp. CCMP2097]